MSLQWGLSCALCARKLLFFAYSSLTYPARGGRINRNTLWRKLGKGGTPIKKVTVLIGNFGSGKTELALNFALRAARGGKTELIDLDVVNTYFRLSERRALVECAGIRLVTPNYVGSNVESFSLPPDIASAFDMDWDHVIFDAGGDPVGATALGRFRDRFLALPEGSLEVLDVVNVRRPLSGTADRIVDMAQELQRSARLAITGFINNTNLAALTGEAELRDGYALLREASRHTGIPVSYTAGKPDTLAAFLALGLDKRYIGTPMEIRTYLHRDWDTYVKKGI
jgi:hypothetical protein